MKKLKIILLRTGLLTILLLPLFMCSNEESRLEQKWQMRQIIRTDGNIQVMDSLFYNFMNGTFSSIGVLPSGGYESCNGTYTLSGDELSIRIIPQDTMKLKENPFLYMQWGDPSQAKQFRISLLNSSSLRLVSGECTFVFRKY